MLITHLAAAESRCVKLDRQLDHMRRMLHNVKADRTSMLKEQVSPVIVVLFIACVNISEFNPLLRTFCRTVLIVILFFQVSMETSRSANKQSDTESQRVQLEKLERLEQEYLRLTRTQNNAEVRAMMHFGWGVSVLNSTFVCETNDISLKQKDIHKKKSLMITTTIILICFWYVRLRFSSWRRNYRKRSTRESWFRKRPIRCQHLKPNTPFITLACFNLWQRVMFPIPDNYLVNCSEWYMAHAKCTIFMSWQLQTGLEANRILLRSVSPCLSGRQSKERKSNSKVKLANTLRMFSSHFHTVWTNVAAAVQSSSSALVHSIKSRVKFSFLSPESHPTFTFLCLGF